MIYWFSNRIHICFSYFRPLCTKHWFNPGFDHKYLQVIYPITVAITYEGFWYQESLGAHCSQHFSCCHDQCTPKHRSCRSGRGFSNRWSDLGASQDDGGPNMPKSSCQCAQIGTTVCRLPGKGLFPEITCPLHFGISFCNFGLTIENDCCESGFKSSWQRWKDPNGPSSWTVRMTAPHQDDIILKTHIILACAEVCDGVPAWISDCSRVWDDGIQSITDRWGLV